MGDRYIMTAFGKDRPGIAADVTEILYENGCNLEDTRMTLLADEFTLILLFTCSDGTIEENLSKECRRLEREKGISAFMRPIESISSRAPSSFFLRTIHVEGLDQAGIVFRISRFLSENKINIVDLKSFAKASPESGTAIYIMDIQVQIPTNTDMEMLSDGLTDVGDDLNVDVAISD